MELLLDSGAMQTWESLAISLDALTCSATNVVRSGSQSIQSAQYVRHISKGKKCICSLNGMVSTFVYNSLVREILETFG